MKNDLIPSWEGQGHSGPGVGFLVLERLTPARATAVALRHPSQGEDFS